MSCNVAFIGLGVMGYPMAGYISKGGHNVTVFNRTKSKAEKWVSEYSGKLAETPAEAAKNAEYVFTCVGNDNDLREVTFGDKGVFKTINKGAIYVESSFVDSLKDSNITKSHISEIIVNYHTSKNIIGIFSSLTWRFCHFTFIFIYPLFCF